MSPENQPVDIFIKGQPEVLDVARQPTEEITAEQRHLGRFALRVASFSLGGALIGAGVATFGMPAHTHIGGAEASVNLQLGNHSEANTGSNALLGLKHPAHYGPIGVHATIDNFGFGLRPDLSPSVQNEYAQLFADPAQDKKNVEMALVRQAVYGAAIADGLILAGVLGSMAGRSLRRRRDPELAEVLSSPSVVAHRKQRHIRLAAGLSVSVAALGVNQYIENSKPLHPNSILSGTTLAGSEIDGLLAPAIISLVPFIADKIETTDRYYSQDDKNLAASFKQQIGQIEKDDSSFYVLAISDRHCNTGMNRIIKKVAELYNVSLVLDAGDDAFSGSFSFESACVTTLMDSIRKIAPVVESPGNHDSTITTAAAIKAKMIVLLDGKPVTITVAGTSLRIIGAADPRSSRYGEGIQPSSSKDQRAAITKEGDQLAQAAHDAQAEGNPINIVLAHDGLAIQEVLDANYGVQLGVGGHTHLHRGTDLRPNSSYGHDIYQLIEGSTGGAGINETGGITVAGPLLADAPMTVLRIDKQTKVPIGEYTIINHPDQTFTLGEYTPLKTVAKLSPSIENQIR